MLQTRCPVSRRWSLARAEFYEAKVVESKVEFLNFVRVCMQLGVLGSFTLTDCDAPLEPGSTIALLLRERQLEPSILRQDRVQPARTRNRRLHSMAGITFVALQSDSVWRGEGDHRDSVIDSWLYKDTFASTPHPQPRMATPRHFSDQEPPHKHEVDATPSTEDAPKAEDGAHRPRFGLPDLPVLSTNGAEASPHRPLDSRQTSVDFNQRIKVRVLAQDALKGERLAQAIAATKHDLTEFFREVRLVHSFGRHNHDALCKIFKKYRKNVGGHLHELPAISSLLASCDFYVSEDSFAKTEAEHLLQEVEQLYELSFEPYGTARERRKNAVAALHVTSLVTSPPRQLVRCGVLIGVARPASGIRPESLPRCCPMLWLLLRRPDCSPPGSHRLQLNPPLFGLR